GDELIGDLENVGVESAGKSFVAAYDNQQHALLRPYDKQRVAQVARSLVEDVDAARQRLEDVGDHLCVWPGRERSLLRTTQLGRRDHLHGPGDLARVLHAADAPP